MSGSRFLASYRRGVALLILAAVQVAISLARAAETNGDERQNLETSGYVGLAIDTFAASDLNRYLNQDASGGLRERGIAGVDFAYRLAGERGGRRQLWLYGETIHGARSTDIDCAAHPGFPTCRPFQSQISASGQFLYILRNATSLEAFGGLRWEIVPVRRSGNAPANFYLKAQAGFLSVAGAGDDLVDVHHVAAGLYVVGGDYRDSYVEAGYGRTDLFRKNPDRRLKIDGMLVFPWHPRRTEMHAFLQMTVDTDLGGGADSVQSYVGVDFRFVK
jgi:hypothetical protein